MFNEKILDLLIKRTSKSYWNGKLGQTIHIDSLDTTKELPSQEVRVKTLTIHSPSAEQDFRTNSSTNICNDISKTWFGRKQVRRNKKPGRYLRRKTHLCDSVQCSTERRLRNALLQLLLQILKHDAQRLLTLHNTHVRFRFLYVFICQVFHAHPWPWHVSNLYQVNVLLKNWIKVDPAWTDELEF